MTEVETPPAEPGDQEVPGNRRRFADGRLAGQAQSGRDGPFVHRRSPRETRILRVLNHRHCEESGVLERPAQQVPVADPVPVVGKRDRAGAPHFPELGELLPPAAARDGPDRIDARGPGFRAPRRDECGHGAVVVDRVRIRHRADRREAAGRRGGCAGCDRLRVFAPRLAQVDVEIDEPGKDEQPRGVKDEGAVVGEPLVHRFHPAVAQENVERAVPAVSRVHDGASADQEIARHVPSRSPSQGRPVSSR